jgi:hypothetical protein
VFEGDDKGIRRLGKGGNILNALKCLRTEFKKKKKQRKQEQKNKFKRTG